ncbi:MAG: hypothetical protein WCI92_00625 [Bacteroidota bacterium]
MEKMILHCKQGVRGIETTSTITIEEVDNYKRDTHHELPSTFTEVIFDPEEKVIIRKRSLVFVFISNDKNSFYIIDDIRTPISMTTKYYCVKIPIKLFWRIMEPDTLEEFLTMDSGYVTQSIKSENIKLRKNTYIEFSAHADIPSVLIIHRDKEYILPVRQFFDIIKPRNPLGGKWTKIIRQLKIKKIEKHQ